MKKIVVIISILFIVSCNSESAPDCFQNSGDVITKDFSVTAFSKITVFDNVELVLKEGPNHTVRVSTGAFLMDDIDVVLVGNRLKLYDNNGCNITRDYGITKIYVEAPNVTEIRSSTRFPIRSEGVLNYPELNLLSEDFNATESGIRVGIFDLEVNSSVVRATVNGLSTIYLSGQTANLNISYVAGDARFEGRFLVADNVNIFHRGTNDITVNPQLKLKANLVSTGNVISVNTPADLDVQEQYIGRVIFE